MNLSRSNTFNTKNLKSILLYTLTIFVLIVSSGVLITCGDDSNTTTSTPINTIQITSRIENNNQIVLSFNVEGDEIPSNAVITVKEKSTTSPSISYEHYVKRSDSYSVPRSTNEIRYYQAEYTTSSSKTIKSPILTIVFGSSSTSPQVQEPTNKKDPTPEKGSTSFPFYLDELKSKGVIVVEPTNVVAAEVTAIDQAFKNRDNVNANEGTGGFETHIDGINQLKGHMTGGTTPANFDLVAYWGDWSTWDHRKFDISDIPTDNVTSINYGFFSISDGTQKTFKNVGRTFTPPAGVILPADDGSAYLTKATPITKLWPDDAGGPIGWGKGNFNALGGLSTRSGVSIGGWTLSVEFPVVAEDASAKRTAEAGGSTRATKGDIEYFIESIIFNLKEYNIDAVDLDWEFPENNNHKQGFKDMVYFLREALDAEWPPSNGVPQKLISIAISPNPSKMDYVPLDDGEFVENVDRIKLMSYDLAGAFSSITGHHANILGSSYDGKAPTQKENELGTDTAVKKIISMFNTAGKTESKYKKKVRIGVAFYGRAWGGVNLPTENLPTGWKLANNQDARPLIGVPVNIQSSGKGVEDNGNTYGPIGSFGNYGVFNYAHIRHYFLNYSSTTTSLSNAYSGKNGFYRLWDDNAKSPILYNPLAKVLITYDDNQSIEAKIKYVHDNGLGGVLVWMISEDYNGELLSSINKEANKYTWP